LKPETLQLAFSAFPVRVLWKFWQQQLGCAVLIPLCISKRQRTARSTLPLQEFRDGNKSFSPHEKKSSLHHSYGLTLFVLFRRFSSPKNKLENEIGPMQSLAVRTR
jgi:hypothetical protein